MIKVSIIIPVYNTERYLERCLKSVVNQTLKEKEIIIINDGSTDNSHIIINKYKNLYNNIIVINQDNQGAASARNRGLRIASGEYIGFVDSDDLVSPSMYEELYYYAKKEEVDIVEGEFKSVKFSSINYKVDKEFKFYKYTTKEALKNFFKSFNGSVCFGIYRNKLFKNVNFPEGKIYEDMYCKAQLIYNANGLVILNKTFYFYSERLNSTIKSKFSKKDFDYIIITKALIKYFIHKDKISFIYYAKEIIELLVHSVYFTIEKSIRDNYFKNGNLLPKGISSKYIFLILILGLIINPKKYLLSLSEILFYFLSLACKGNHRSRVKNAKISKI